MPDANETKLSRSALKAHILEAVAVEDIDQIPPDFDDAARFIICAVRAIARRSAGASLCCFVYSEAPMPEGKPLGFSRVAHMQDGHGDLDGSAVLTSRDANNGALRALQDPTILQLMGLLEDCGLDDRLTVFWDGAARTATVYPAGVSDDADHLRFPVPVANDDLTQEDICVALDLAYNDNLKNPSGHTVKLWRKKALIVEAEDEIERHLKGQLALYFAGRSKPVKVWSQTNITAGRTDLVLIQRPPGQNPQLVGVIELKVLRGPQGKDLQVAIEGLSQAYEYRADMGVPFATLALYDVTADPTDDMTTIEPSLDVTQKGMVRIRRFPIFNSPQKWRISRIEQAA
jgi:hypothetical protein